MIDSKNYDLRLNGGTPFEKETPLEGYVNSPGTASLWEAVKNTPKTPHLSVKVWKLSKSMIAQTK